ncbi:MAG: glycosyltransferase [Acidobacteria bacterium]|nr:glycosyltransferase [Acidobacteriota bacterium]
MKINVLQLIGSFHQGGSERQAVQLVRLLHDEGTYRVFIACLDKSGVVRGEIEQLGYTDFPEFPLTSFYDRNMFRQLRRCAKFLRECDIKIVQTSDFYTNIFGIIAATMARVPVKIASKRETGEMRSAKQDFLERRIFAQSDAIVANSKAVKNYLVKGGAAANKIEVIYNGLDLQRLAAKETNRRKICERLNLPFDQHIKFITLTANLRHTVKNQPMFLRAAKIISEKFPAAHFVLAGEGELRNDLENLAGQLQIADRIHFTGRCAQVPDLLSISFAGVLTSFAEGFSNSILEYMSANLPVVATNVGGASEAITPDKTGFLVESDDAEALSEKLVWLLEKPAEAERMGNAGRKIVKEKFSCERQLQRTLELYEESVDIKEIGKT